MNPSISDFTVSELSDATGKPEALIRQHIVRGHLKSRRKPDGRVVIPHDCALQWAAERGFKFRSTDETQSLFSRASSGSAHREARVRLIAIKDGVEWRNVCTTFRHRRSVARATDSGWRKTRLDDDAILFERDLDWNDCAALLTQIISSALEIDGVVVRFVVGQNPIESYLPRGEGETYPSTLLKNPFNPFSCRVHEFWAPELEGQRILGLGAGKCAHAFKGAGVDLERYIDRLGNVLVFGALDRLKASSTFQGKNTFRISVRGVDPVVPPMWLTVKFFRSGNMIEAKGFELNEPNKAIPMPITCDGYEFAIFDRKTGELIDSESAILLREIRFSMSVLGPQVNLRDPNNRPVKSFQSTQLASTSSVTLTDPHMIDARYRDRILHVAELDAASSKDVLFVPPGEEAKCFATFREVIGTFPAEEKAFVYWADPYFLSSPGARGYQANWTNSIRRNFLDVLESLQGRELRVICCHDVTNGNSPEEILDFVSSLPGIRLSIKCVLKRNPTNDGFENAFHSRWLASSNREYMITNSLSGWNSDGVEFARLARGIYFARSNFLWGLDGANKDYRMSEHRLPAVRVK